MSTVSSKNKLGKGKSFEDEMKISRVMECPSVGDLFAYCEKILETRNYLMIGELYCIVEQIANGQW